MTLTIELQDEDVRLLNAQASVNGVSAEQCARQLLKQALASAPATRLLSARIREIWSDTPDEARAERPADGAEQIDHYVYGVPKRNNVELPILHLGMMDALHRRDIYDDVP